jgi:hypothetical protein
MLVWSDTSLQTSISSNSGNSYLGHTFSLFCFGAVPYKAYVRSIPIVEGKFGLLSIIEDIDDIGIIIIPCSELLCALKKKYFIFE